VHLLHQGPGKKTPFAVAEQLGGQPSSISVPPLLPAGVHMPPGLEKPAAVAGTEEPSSEQADAHNHGPGKQTPFVDSEGLGGQVPQNQTQQAQHHQEQLQQQHQQQPQQL